LLEEFHPREKTMNFEHERIAERMIHARDEPPRMIASSLTRPKPPTPAASSRDTKAVTPGSCSVLDSRRLPPFGRHDPGCVRSGSRFYTQAGTFDWWATTSRRNDMAALAIGSILNGSPQVISWGWLQITLANLVVIGLMVVAFIVAVLAPFPRGKR
jgi:hypothetical protein